MFTAILLLVVVLSSGDAIVAMIWVGGWRALVSTIVGCHWRGCTKIVVEGLLSALLLVQCCSINYLLYPGSVGAISGGGVGGDHWEEVVE